MYFLKTNLYKEQGLDIKKHKYSIRIFQCPECHEKMYAAKGSAVKTPKGHVKTMFCPYCHCDQDFIQIDTK